jgi:hypothetical protein
VEPLQHLHGAENDGDNCCRCNDGAFSLDFMGRGGALLNSVSHAA